MFKQLKRALLDEHAAAGNLLVKLDYSTNQLQRRACPYQ